MRRTSILAPLLVATIALVGCASDDGTSTTSDGGGATTSTGAVLPETVPDRSGTVSEDDAVRTVTAWISALADGDVDAAWALVDPSSQVAFGGRDVFDQSGSAFAEGYGAWASVPDLTTTWIPLGGGGDVGVVVLQGTLRQEGTTTPAAAQAIPVRAEDDGALVDPFHQIVDPGRVTVEPDAGTTLEPGATVRVSAPGAEQLELFVDDQSVATTRSVGAAVAELESSVPSEAGAVAVTLVAQQDDGSVQALSFGYPIAG